MSAANLVRSLSGAAKGEDGLFTKLRLASHLPLKKQLSKKPHAFCTGFGVIAN